MKILTTPEGAVDHLDDYRFDRRYVTIPAGDGQQLRVHMVDTGPADAEPIVFLHGNPSWSYIWRHQIDAVAARGGRAIAVDLVGMGMSDKPSDIDDYSVTRHADWMRAALFDALDLRDVTLVLHDWGGIIGLRLVAGDPDRVRRVAISNTGFPSRDPMEPVPVPDEPSGPYADFQAFARTAEVWEPWTLLPMCMETEPAPAVTEGYRAPYPEPELTVGSRAFTQLLPTTRGNAMLTDNHEAWEELERFERPVVTIFSDRDVVAPTGYQAICERIPGAAGQPHVILKGGGHFLQEDIPEAYTAALVDWLDRSA